MIDIIIGKKGSGKTKKLIENANEAATKTSGNVVVIEKGNKLTYDLSHDVRLVDIDAYGIQGPDALAGFVSGICAGNYDVTDILVDSTLKIVGSDLKVLIPFAEKMSSLSSLANTKITFSISADESELPEEIRGISTII